MQNKKNYTSFELRYTNRLHNAAEDLFSCIKKTAIQYGCKTLRGIAERKYFEYDLQAFCPKNRTPDTNPYKWYDKKVKQSIITDIHFGLRGDSPFSIQLDTWSWLNDLCKLREEITCCLDTLPQYGNPDKAKQTIQYYLKEARDLIIGWHSFYDAHPEGAPIANLTNF